MRKFLLIAGLLSFISLSANAGQDTLLSLAARTATTTSDNVIRSKERALHFVINVTVAPGGGQTLTPVIQGVDFLGNVYPLLNGAAITTTGVTVLKVGNAVAPSANASAQDMIPDIYNIKMTHSAGGSWTYSVTVQKGD